MVEILFFGISIIADCRSRLVKDECYLSVATALMKLVIGVFGGGAITEVLLFMDTFFGETSNSAIYVGIALEVLIICAVAIVQSLVHDEMTKSLIKKHNRTKLNTEEGTGIRSRPDEQTPLMSQDNNRIELSYLSIPT